MQNHYRIFLASSEKLKTEREQIEIAISRLNHRLNKKGAKLETVLWENIDPRVVVDGMQSGYNEALKDCHFLVLLIWGELGKFTQKEYQLATDLLAKGQIKKIYIFEKTITPTFSPKDENIENLKALKVNLNTLDKENWPIPFEHVDTVVHKLEHWIKEAFDDPSQTGIVYGEPATLLSPNGAADPHVFVGRDEELKEIRKRLDKSGKLMLINAEGGIGKTTLAAKYWNESLHEYKHNAWLFCEQGIVNAIKELAPKLNIDLAGMDEDQQLKALKKALSDVHDDFLLVLDNANDDEEIRVFRQEFEGFHWHVLITSRCQGVLDKEQELPISHLPPPLAKALFERYYKEDTADFEALLGGLLQKLNYHTLSVELFAKTLKELAERGETMKHFVQKLETEGIFLGKRAKDINTDYTHHTRIAGRNSDEILANFYNFTHLATDENLRYYLVNMAFLPAKEYDFVFLCELFKQDPIEFEALHQLATKGWLSKNGQKFKINPIIQEIALHKNKESLGTDAQALLDRLNSILAADAYNLLNISLTAAEPFIKLLPQLNKSIIDFPNQSIGILNYNASVFFRNIGDILNNQNSVFYFREINKKLLKKDPENLNLKFDLAVSFSKLGQIFQEKGDWEKALEYYQEDNILLTEIYKSAPDELFYKDGLAMTFNKLGEIYEQVGNYSKAFNYYQEFNKLEKELTLSCPENLDYKNHLASSYSKLGEICFETGDLKNALMNFENDYNIMNEIYNSYPSNLNYKDGLAISNSKLGKFHEHTGDLKTALIFYQEYNRLENEITKSSPENLKYKSELGSTYERLGDIHQKLRNGKESLFYYIEFNKILKEIKETCPESLRYKFGLAISYSRLGDIYSENSDSEKAIHNYLEFNNLIKQILAQSPDNQFYKNGLAISFACLGAFYFNQSDLNKWLFVIYSG